MKAKIQSHTRLLVVAMAVASLSLAGCGKTTKSESKKPAKLVQVESVQAQFSPIFSVELPSAGKLKHRGVAKKDILRLQVAGDNQFLLAASSSGIVSAYQAGQLAWSADVGEAIVSGVAYDASGQVVVVGTRSGKIIALDSQTGEQRWTQNLGATSLAPALIAGNRVLVSANNGVIYGLNLRTGANVWQFTTQLPNVSVRGMAKPLRLDGSTAVFGTSNGRIHALSIDKGQPLWTRRVGVAIGGSDVGRMSDVDGTPLAVGSYLYVTSFSGNLSGFDMSTGQTMFTVRDFPSVHSVAYQNQTLIGVDIDGVVRGFDALTGGTVWTSDALKYRKLSNPVSVGNYVAIGDYEGVVHLFDSAGAIVGRTKTKGRVVSLQAQGNELYAQTQEGQVVVWQVQ